MIQNQGAFFAVFRLRRKTAKNRAMRGSAIAPAPALRAVAAPHPSYPLRPKGLFALRAALLSIVKVNAVALIF
jgi:hypothetical protein